MTALSEQDIAKVLDLFAPGAGAAISAALSKARDAFPRPAPPPGPLPPPAAPPPGAPGEEAASPPAAGLTRDQIFDRLQDLSVPPLIWEKAKPIFAKANYMDEIGEAEDQYSEKILRPYTLVTRHDGIRLGLVWVPREIYVKKEMWGSLTQAIDNIDAFVRFLSEGHSDTYSGFETFLQSAAERGKRWAFTPWTWVERLLAGEDPIDEVFKLPKPGKSPSPLSLDRLTDGDRGTIKEWLIQYAGENANVKPGQRMRNLADAAGWPPQMKNKIAGMGDDPETIATEVLQLAISWLRFESQSERAGDTYLGTLLQALLPQVGDPQTKIATLILRYNLVKRPTAVSEVKKYLA